MFSIILDVIVILVFCFCVYIGYRRGFIASVLILGKFFAALALSWFISKTLAPLVFNTLIRSSVIALVNNKLSSAGNISDLQNAFAAISASIPDFLNEIMFDGQSISDMMPNDFSVNLTSLSQGIVDNFIGPIIILLLEVILFALLFIIVRLIFRWFTNMTRGVNRIPVIGTLNGLLGSITGALQAVIYLMLAGMVLDLVIFFTNNDLSFINTQVIESTNLFMLFYRFNPLKLF